MAAMNGELPESGRVDVGAFASCFDDRTTSYKFFFLLALLDRIEGKNAPREASIGDKPIPLTDLVIDMVLGAWYPHGFCRLSFGSQDKLQEAVDQIDWGPIRGNWIAAGGAEWGRLRGRCAQSLDAEKLIRYVPFRLIRPFFAAETRSLKDGLVNQRVAVLAGELFVSRKPLYCFTEDRSAIVLQHDWLEYLGRNAEIVRGWARYQLAEYLQARNPNVPGIVDKLAPPLIRFPLAEQKTWWKTALPLLGDRARCIYSGAPLDPSDISLDHYLPWSFVAHNRPWNLVPVSRAVNSAKSDSIPADAYLEKLVALQHAGLTAMRRKWPEHKWEKAVEPYRVDLRLENDEALLDLGRLRGHYASTILLLAAIAERQGFVRGWVYGGHGG